MDNKDNTIAERIVNEIHQDGIIKDSRDCDVILVFDIETTETEIISLSSFLFDMNTLTLVENYISGDNIVAIEAKEVNEKGHPFRVHQITKEMTNGKKPIRFHIDKFIEQFNMANTYIGHNVSSDIGKIRKEVEKILDKRDIYNLLPTEIDRYERFLSEFNANDKDTMCTMKCFRHLIGERLITDERETYEEKKSAKLKDVYEYLFRKQVKGQSHDANVDVAMTLCIYVLFVKGVDICADYQYTSDIQHITEIGNNTHVCSLINPENITSEPPLHFDGTLLIEGYQLSREGKKPKQGKQKKLGKNSYVKISSEGELVNALTCIAVQGNGHRCKNPPKYGRSCGIASHRIQAEVLERETATNLHTQKKEESQIQKYDDELDTIATTRIKEKEVRKKNLMNTFRVYTYGLMDGIKSNKVRTEGNTTRSTGRIVPIDDITNRGGRRRSRKRRGKRTKKNRKIYKKN